MMRNLIAGLAAIVALSAQPASAQQFTAPPVKVAGSKLATQLQELAADRRAQRRSRRSPSSWRSRRRAACAWTSTSTISMPNRSCATRA